MAQPPVWLPIFTKLMQATDPATELQNYYYFYNALLYNAFPLDQNYAVGPQPTSMTDAVYSLIGYYVEFGKYIVLSVAIKPSNVFSNPEWIADAQDQIYSRFRTMRPTIQNSHLPVYVIISAIGFRCRVYTYTLATDQVEPPNRPSTPDQWHIDLTTDQGRVRLLAIFQDIRERSALLPQNVPEMEL